MQQTGRASPDAAMRYGALMDHRLLACAAEAAALKGRRRMNVAPVIMGLFLPWLLFLGMYAASNFYLHYAAPITTLLILVGATLLCVSLWSSAVKTRKEGLEDSFYRFYLAAAMTVALLAGWLIGDMCFWELMQPCYEIEHLATYTNVNPSSERQASGEIVPTRGRRYQDAGKIYFDHTAVVDVSRAMSFKMGDLYCVAPIIDPGCAKNCGMDFWAVGVNCCEEDTVDFRCGEYNSTHAKSGLRLMSESQRKYFRLAVLQAEGAHEVVSTHPLFFHFMQDPVAEVRRWERHGYGQYLVAMFASFAGSAFALGLSMKLAHIGGLS
mmetsp:Transcript_54195/g.117103  ORF Transcript_54195/g.117103 Transcript_54195/m.117103 type:complete len:324 (-) Transcript_54195:81-1052(-)